MVDTPSSIPSGWRSRLHPRRGGVVAAPLSPPSEAELAELERNADATRAEISGWDRERVLMASKALWQIPKKTIYDSNNACLFRHLIESRELTFTLQCFTDASWLHAANYALLRLNAGARPLRVALANASSADFEACRVIAEAAFWHHADTSSPRPAGEALALAYLFPDEAWWELARYSSANSMLATCPLDPQAVQQLLRSSSSFDPGTLETVVANLGPAAGEVFAPSLLQAHTGGELTALWRCLPYVPADGAIETIVDSIGEKYGLKAALAAVNHQPERTIRVAVGWVDIVAGLDAHLRAWVARHPEVVESIRPQLSDEHRHWLDEAEAKAEAGAQRTDSPDLPTALAQADPYLAATKNKANAFWKPDELPPLRLSSGREVSRELMPVIGSWLSASTKTRLHPGLAELAEQCRRGSLAKHVWTLFQQWVDAGCPGGHGWLLASLAHLGADECAVELARLTRTPGTPLHRRGKSVVDCLARMPVPLAPALIVGLAHEGTHTTRNAALAALAKLAREAGRQPGELEDELARLVSGDHADALVHTQSVRIASAMVFARSWPADGWSVLVAEAPAFAQVASGLVWLDQSRRGGRVRSFRLRSDGICVNASGAPLTPAGDVRPAHPVDLDERELNAWQRQFDAAERTQPFPQLARRFHRLSSAASTDHHEVGWVSPTGAGKKQLVEQGWRAYPAGIDPCYELELADPVESILLTLIGRNRAFLSVIDRECGTPVRPITSLPKSLVSEAIDALYILGDGSVALTGTF